MLNSSNPRKIKSRPRKSDMEYWNMLKLWAANLLFRNFLLQPRRSTTVFSRRSCANSSRRPAGEQRASHFLMHIRHTGLFLSSMIPAVSPLYSRRIVVREQGKRLSLSPTPLNPCAAHADSITIVRAIWVAFLEVVLRASAAGGGEIRTRGPRSGRRFSRPVVSTTHPPLR